MGYILSFLAVVLMTLLALVVIMGVGPLRRFAGLGAVAPSGPAGAIAAKTGA